jgi:hypothetical protein
MERIGLAREYRVAEWLRDAYSELVRTSPSDLEKLLPTEPYSDNWDAKKWEAISRDWETLARLFLLKTKIDPIGPGKWQICDGSCARGPGDPCNCRVLWVLSMVNEAFREELEGLREDLDLLSRKLPLLS